MRIRWLRTVVLTCASCIPLCTAASRSLAHQLESEATCGQPDPATPVFMDFGRHSVGCNLLASDDVDTFFFPVFAGMRLRLLLRGESDGLDPRLVLVEGGVPFFDGSCDAGAGRCTLTHERVAPADGVYFAEVSDAGADETGDYVLQLEEIPGEVDEVIDQDEFSELERLDPATDVDHFKLSAAVGQAIEIVLESCDAHLDPHLEAWGPNGALLADVSCTTPDGPPPDFGLPETCHGSLPGSPDLCSATAEFEVQVTGVQRFSVSDLGSDSPGRFRYTLNRVPETGAAPAAALAVLAGLAQRRRRARAAASPRASRAPVDGSGTS